jgi:hypothetical protein
LTLRVSDENPNMALICKLVDVVELLHICPTAKHPQVVDHRLPPMSEPDQDFCWDPIQEVDRGDHDLSPKLCRHPSLLEEHLFHRYDGLFPPLYYPVLLWIIGHREVSKDPSSVQ